MNKIRRSNIWKNVITQQEKGNKGMIAPSITYNGTLFNISKILNKN